MSVVTQQLLEPVSDPSTVEVSVEVITRVTRQSMDNFAFG
jgi:hypothetical protein